MSHKLPLQLILVFLLAACNKPKSESSSEDRVKALEAEVARLKDVPENVRSKENEDVPTPDPLPAIEREVIGYMETLKSRYWLNDGDVWLTRFQLTNRQDDILYLEAKGLEYRYTPNEATEADRLNGIEWRGQAVFTVVPTRSYSPKGTMMHWVQHPAGWTPWKSEPFMNPGFQITNSNGQWNAQALEPAPITKPELLEVHKIAGRLTAEENELLAKNDEALIQRFSSVFSQAKPLTFEITKNDSVEYRCQIQFEKPARGAFAGTISFPKGTITRIEGVVSDDVIRFQETRKVQRGDDGWNAGDKYVLRHSEGNVLRGDRFVEGMFGERNDGPVMLYLLGSPAQSLSPASHSSSEDNARTPNSSSLSEAQALAGERYPETRSKFLTPEDIKTWNYPQLRYAINEMYARHGLYFKDDSLRNLFVRFPWYKPDSRLTFEAIESRLSDIEIQNLRVLGELRNARKP